MFSDGRNAVMYDRRGVKRNTDIGGWNRCRKVMQSHRPGFLDDIGLFDMPLVLHKEESNYVLPLATLVGNAGNVGGVMGLEACCLGHPNDQYHLIRDTDVWSWELDV